MKNIALLLLLLFCCLHGLRSQDCFIYANKDKKMYFYENKKAIYVAFKHNINYEKKQNILEALDSATGQTHEKNEKSDDMNNFGIVINRRSFCLL